MIALHTESSSDTIRGALTEATLPVVIRRTCVKTLLSLSVCDEWLLSHSSLRGGCLKSKTGVKV